MKRHPKTIVLVGPTASGKSDLAILLARKYNGEIISADSRQVYLGMDIGTGKVTRDKVKGHPKLDLGSNKSIGEPYYSEKIPHWLLDIANPKRNYNVTHFVRDAKKILKDIEKRGKTPIICGGTGFWVQALIEDNAFPAVKPNLELRRKFEKLSTEKLFEQLKKKDPRRAKTIDQKNKVRLIRALEIIATLGRVPKTKKNKINNDAYIILALNPEKEVLHSNIETRLEKRLKKGMVAEIKKLRKEGLSWKKLESFGLEYKYVALFIQKKISKEEMKEKLNFEIRHYAKRQITWLKRFEKMGAHIHWISDPKQAITILKKT